MARNRGGAKREVPQCGCEGLHLGRYLRKPCSSVLPAHFLLRYLHSAFIPLLKLGPGQELTTGNKNRIVFRNPEAIPEEHSSKDNELNIVSRGTDAVLRERRFGPRNRRLE